MVTTYEITRIEGEIIFGVLGGPSTRPHEHHAREVISRVLGLEIYVKIIQSDYFDFTDRDQAESLNERGMINSHFLNH